MATITQLYSEEESAVESNTTMMVLKTGDTGFETENCKLEVSYVKEDDEDSCCLIIRIIRGIEFSDIILSIPRERFIEIIRSLEGTVISKLTRDQLKSRVFGDQVIETLKANVNIVKMISRGDIEIDVEQISDDVAVELIKNDGLNEEDVSNLVKALVTGLSTIFMLQNC
jgi:hypothetical protein